MAALQLVEGDLRSVPRLSGLGGEVVRGFYYVPAPLRGTTRSRKVERLARWRLFPNEAVPDEALMPELRAGRRERGTVLLREIFGHYSPDWNRATDEFYLRQRMQRWAGALASVTSWQRVVINPMLEPRFLELGDSLPVRPGRLGHASSAASHADSIPSWQTFPSTDAPHRGCTPIRVSELEPRSPLSPRARSSGRCVNVSHRPGAPPRAGTRWPTWFWSHGAPPRIPSRMFADSA